MLKIIKNKTEWNSYLEKEFKDCNDVFFNSEYFDLYSKHYNARPEAVFWQDKNLKVFWSHLVREFKGYFDLTTPYGYGGPLIAVKTENKKQIEKSFKIFFEEYKKHCLKNNYICEFVRFHPFYSNWQFFDSEYLNDVVVVDLKENLEIKKGHRYNIKKSLKEGCKAEIINDPSEKDIDNFINLYNKTMEKNKAAKKYYFQKDFIRDHFNFLKSFLVQAKYHNKIIGSSLFILGDKIAHYYLSGAKNIKGIYPSNLMVKKAIDWAKENGFEALHLGGGRAKNDSLFKFKKGFSQKTMPFKVGKIIFNQDVFNNLTKGQKNNYFPSYRYNENTII